MWGYFKNDLLTVNLPQAVFDYSIFSIGSLYGFALLISFDRTSHSLEIRYS